MRIIVTGPRDYEDRQFVYDTLNGLYRTYGPFTLVQGACSTGVDAMAHDWYALARRLVPVDEDPFPAHWARLGAYAGPERNGRMVKAGAQLCAAFIGPCTRPHCSEPQPHDSHGTASCIKLAREAGIEVKEFTHE